MATNAEKPRWIYRFDNYQRAFFLLREAVELEQQRPVSQLEKEGIIQRFEYTWELAWKLLKDLLDDGGVELETITPKSVIRAAFAAHIINDGEAWMRALNTRNLMSHTYNAQDFEKAVSLLLSDYLPLLAELHGFCSAKSNG